MPQQAAAARSLSFWIDSATLPVFPRLQQDHVVDVVIVGGGLTGLTTAYLLQKAGKRVALLERNRCAQVDTAYTTAHLTMVTDERLTNLVSRFGRDHAQAVWDAGLAAISQIDEIVRAESIACGFEWVAGYLHLPPQGDGAGVATLQEDAALAADMGFDASFVDAVPLMSAAGIRFDGQARFHPRQYLAGLARAIREAGGEIFEHSAADDFSADPLSVTANGHTIRCDDIVLATHNPLVGLSGVLSATMFQTKLALYTSYVVAGRVAPGTAPDALFWDTGDPYRYFRIEPHRDFDMVIFGGQDHKTGQATDPATCYRHLEEQLTALIPDVDITHRWSGQVIETPDGLPYIGQTTDHQYAGTGFAGNGMTFGTLTGMMSADAILARTNPWVELFEPGRKAIRHGAWEYLKENVDYPYYLIRDRFAGAEGRSLRSIRRGTGQVIERNGMKVAAYRDDDGKTTLRSATCTHMGCRVGWNDTERTWDCPCHGSRFTPAGDVLSGPAESPLEPVE